MDKETEISKKKLLEYIFGEKSEVLQDDVQLNSCRACWAETAGNLSLYTEPVRLKKEILTVRLEKSVYAQELGFLKNAVIDRLKKKGIFVKSIKYEIGPVKKIDLNSNLKVLQSNQSDNKKDLNEAQKELLEGLNKFRG